MNWREEKLNPEVRLSIEVENCLTITESAFLFEDYGYFGIKVPGFTAAMFDELHELNEEINFEFDDKEEIFIRMDEKRCGYWACHLSIHRKNLYLRERNKWLFFSKYPFRFFTSNVARLHRKFWKVY
jgi:hypothetical protein